MAKQRLTVHAQVHVVNNSSRRSGEKGEISRIVYKENGKRTPLPYSVVFSDGEESCFRADELEVVAKSAVQMETEYRQDQEWKAKHYQSVWSFAQSEERHKQLEEHLKAGKPAYHTSPDKTLEYVVRYENDELAYRTGRPYRITLAFTHVGEGETEIIYSALYESLEELDIYEPINVLKLALLKE